MYMPSSIGGILQLMIGGLLASCPVILRAAMPVRNSRPWLFATLNASTVLLLIGFWTREHEVVGGAGIILIGAVASVAPAGLAVRASTPTQPTGSSWLYRFSLISLLVGLVISVAMAFQFIQPYYAHARFLHLHLILLGFVTMAMIGATHHLLPIVLNAELYSPKLARLVMVVLPSGFAILIGGFITSVTSISNLRSEGYSTLASVSTRTIFCAHG